MKKIIFSIAALTIAAFSFGQKKAADVVKFDAEVIEMGKVKQGSPATAKFLITNISNEPILIEQANPTCGCTISDYTKSPIEPGKTGYINATYNAAGVGHFDKHLTVKFAGVDELKSITISGDVISAEEFDKMAVPAAPAMVKASDKAKPVTATTGQTVKSTTKKLKKVKKPATRK
jgi:DNA-binding protein YbaB